MRIIATYFGHESTVVTYNDGDIKIYELDRLSGEKFIRLMDKTAVMWMEVLSEVLELEGNPEYDLWINGTSAPGKGASDGYVWSSRLRNTIRYKRHIIGPASHHLCHAWCAFGQMPVDKGFIISFDGGGSDGVFHTFRSNKKNGIEHMAARDRYDWGSSYHLAGVVAPEVGNTTSHVLASAGKSMALAALWKGDRKKNPRFKLLRADLYKVYSGEFKHMRKIYRDLGLPHDARNRNFRSNREFATIEDENLGRMICAANQEVFEARLLDVVADLQYEIMSRHDGNLILTGGCALNVVANERVKNRIGCNIFVPPNPSDSGIALGQLFYYLNLVGLPLPHKPLHFSGAPLVKDYPRPKKRKATIKSIAKLIKEGNVLAIVEGDAEVGPRALGKRSIVCDPSIEGMKDKLNSQVKKREHYRPFAPVMLEDQAKTYCKTSTFTNMEYMSYACEMNESFVEQFPAVTHVDGSARVQIIYDEEMTLYKLVKEIGTPLLNTSCNIQGQPIIARESEAFAMFDQGIDALVLNGVLYKKPIVDK